jgi:SAM-dependent methyltransferase
MSTNASDRAFTGSLPDAYDTHLVPLIFETYARDVADRVAARSPARVLEIACGTGAVTRELAARLPDSASILATDLNQAMLDRAQKRGTRRPVDWRLVDAQALPFPDASFDAVVCQFGAMFFPDRPRAFAEARRVLAPGGVYAFSVWDRIEDNHFADVVTNALAGLYPNDPPRFLARTPHGYHDRATIERDLTAGGFDPRGAIETVAARSRAESAATPAVGFVEGTPIRNEVEARAPGGLAKATEIARREIVARYGEGPVEGKMQALVALVSR